MKTHSATQPGRPRGPAPGLSYVPRAAWTLLLAFFAAAGVLRAQTFQPVISQVLAAEDNAVYADHEGDYPAVIFIKNNGSVTGTISGYGLTDTPAVPLKWVIPGGAVPITLAPGAVLQVFASAKNRTTSPLATNFLLPCGSTCYLYNPQSSLVSQKVVAGEECPECIPLITPNTNSAYLVPTANNPTAAQGDWRGISFIDSSWPRGQPCLGYETDPLASGMILYATFDAADVNVPSRVITDVSGPAVLHNGSWPNIVPQPISIPVSAPAQVIQSVGFAGPNNPNSYVFYNHHAELNPGTASYTFSIWVRPTNRDNSPEIIFRKGGTATTDPGYSLSRLANAGGARFRIQTGTTNYDTTFSGANLLVADAWTHIAVVIERIANLNQARIYRNGSQMSLVNFPAATSVASPTAQLTQALGGGGLAMFAGFQDDFVTWGRALTNTEITRVFEAGQAGKRVDDPSAPGGAGAVIRPCIQTDVQTAMKGVNTSLYERLHFNITDRSLVNTMTLSMKYSDGFIAYINGVEIARRNAPTGVPAWNSAATADRSAAQAVVPEDIPVPAAGINALVNGTNVLAIHGLTKTPNDPFFLICPELCYDELGPEDCVVTTNGRLFWITFPGNAPEDVSTPLSVSVCITGAAGTIGNVAVPGLGFSQNFTLPVGGKTEIVLPDAASLEVSDTIENKGVRITANKNVAVVGKTRIDYSTDTFLAHPIKCLGSSYITLGWGNSWVGLPDLNGTQFGIVATADNTHVTIKPKVTTNGHAAGVPYNFILNAGQTYMLRNLSSSPADLTGSEITSDSPIAVFGGHRCANVTGSFFFCDTVIEQTLPVALWNTEYVVAPLATRTGDELVRLVASENATNITVNGVAIVPALNKGDKRDITVPAGTGAVFASTKKFLAAHMSRSSDADDVDEADPFQLNCQPTASWLAGYRFCTPTATEFSTFYVNVIARNAELAGVTISPAPVLTGAITPIGASAYSYRQLKLAAGTTYTTGGRTHGLEVYGWGLYDSYGHSGGMTFADTQPPIFAQCPPDVTIFTTNIPGAGELADVPDFAAQFGVTDNCCPDQSLVVVQTPSPGSRVPAGDYQVVIQVTDCNGNTITCVFNLHVRTDPRAIAFPTAFGNPALESTIWGWHANPDGDCLNNEQEYALGTNMAVNAPYGDAFTFSVVTYLGQRGVEVSYRKRNDDPSLDYTPEGSGDLVGWFSGLGHFEQTSATPDSMPGFTRIRAFSHDSTEFSRFYLRLNIRRN